MADFSIEDYIKKRNEVLRQLLWKEYWALLKEQNPQVTIPAYEERKEIALIAMHKIRYELAHMGNELREESRAWLESHGFGRYGGRPWPPAGVLEDNPP